MKPLKSQIKIDADLLLSDVDEDVLLTDVSAVVEVLLLDGQFHQDSYVYQNQMG